MGSAGQSQGGGSRVLPGKRMAGRMGGQQHTVQNLKVLHVEPELGVVVVNGECSLPPSPNSGDTFLQFFVGAVSGPKGCVVELQDAIKKPMPQLAVQS